MWYVNFYIDACHSGTCKDDTQKWLEQREGGEVIHRDGDDLSVYGFVKYFDRKAQLELKVFMSCRGNQVAFDAGEGQGSLWTNYYLAKGNMYCFYGHEFKQGDKVQTTQGMGLRVYKKE